MKHNSAAGQTSLAAGIRAPWRLFLICLPVSIALYWPTLRLAWSPIDNYYHLHYAGQAIGAGRSDGLPGFIEVIIAPEENIVGPAYRLAATLERLAFGLNPWLWRLAQIAAHAATLAGLCWLVRLGGGRAGAQAIAALSFACFGPQSGYPDFQTHYAAFARLFVTDMPVALLSVWTCGLLLRALCSPGRRRAWKAVAFLALLATACLTKINAFHLAGAFCAYLLFVAALPRAGNGAKGRLLQSAALLAVTLLACLPGALFFRPWEGAAISAYEAADLAPLGAKFLPNAARYLRWISESLGPLWLLAIGLAFVRVARRILPRARRRVWSGRASARLLLLVCLGTGLVFQCLWPIALPRYMLLFSPFLCALFGLEIAAAAAWLARQLGIRRPGLRGLMHFTLGAALVALWLWPCYLPAKSDRMQGIWIVLWTAAVFIGSVWGLALLAKGIPRRKRAFIRFMPLWLLSGLLFWQAVVQAAYTRESAVSYLAWESAHGRLMRYARNLARQISPGREAVIYTNLKTGGLVESVDLLVREILGAPNIHVLSWPAGGLAKIGELDRIAVIHDYNRAGELDIPPIAFGRSISRLHLPDRPAPYASLVPGERINIPVALDQDSVIALAGLAADPYTWPENWSVDIVAGEDGETSGGKIMASLRGCDVPRNRSGAFVQLLDAPFDLSTEIHSLELRCRSNRDPWIAYWPSTENRVKISLNAASDGASPAQTAPPSPILLWGAPASAPVWPLLDRESISASSLLFASPAFVFTLARHGVPPWKRWSAASFRIVHYRYVFEAYGAPE